MEMQSLKPSILMGKLKQHLPPGVSPDMDLFLAMFLAAADIVKAASALLDARGGHDPMVAGATTQCPLQRPP
jgi:hypothetical protein